eukprot:gene55203-73743_t
MAPVLGLTITEAQRPVVLQFLTIAHGMAEIVAAAPIDEASLELAPVFRPGVPEVREGDVTAVAVTEAFLARIAALDPVVNAFTDITA